MVKTLGVVLSNVKCNFMQGSNIHCEHARPCQCVPGDFSRDSTFSPEKNILMNLLTAVGVVGGKLRPLTQENDHALLSKLLSPKASVCE